MREAIKSPNFDERRGGARPGLIILHYTGMESAAAALARLCDPAAKVSAHYFIDEEGGVLQLVDEAKRAWHAGASYWQGERDVNSASIGIELVNPGHEFGYRPFPPAQVTALTDLCKRLMEKYKIPPEGVLGHSDIAPGRKADPGELFPWAALAGEGIGRWHEIRERAVSADLRALMLEMGYDPEADFETLEKAFNRRYFPEKLKT